MSKKKSFFRKNEELTWVCAACGKTSEDKYSFSDSTCSSHAVQCYNDKNKDGQWEAVKRTTIRSWLRLGRGSR